MNGDFDVSFVHLIIRTYTVNLRSWSGKRTWTYTVTICFLIRPFLCIPIIHREIVRFFVVCCPFHYDFECTFSTHALCNKLCQFQYENGKKSLKFSIQRTYGLSSADTMLNVWILMMVLRNRACCETASFWCDTEKHNEKWKAYGWKPKKKKSYPTTSEKIICTSTWLSGSITFIYLYFSSFVIGRSMALI